MTKPLANRIALVTGASRGIGYATALALAEAGAHIVAVARTVGGLEELDDAVRAAGSTATLVPLDLKDSPAIDRLGAAIQQRYGKLDILVGNAGILGTLSPLDHVQPKDWDDVLAVNVTANWRIIKACVDLLKASDAGRAVFVTTVPTGTAYWGPYAVSKAALDMLVRTFAAETATTKVRVNMISPGQVRTRLLTAAMPSLDMTHITKPDVVARAIVELCLPSVTESGKVYDLQAGRFRAFQLPA
jgi:NAD(P)-dependent dehydrogenase (short-subunit alcohol dehydrogenase family)